MLRTVPYGNPCSVCIHRWDNARELRCVHLQAKKKEILIDVFGARSCAFMGIQAKLAGISYAKQGKKKQNS